MFDVKKCVDTKNVEFRWSQAQAMATPTIDLTSPSSPVSIASSPSPLPPAPPIIPVPAQGPSTPTGPPTPTPRHEDLLSNHPSRTPSPANSWASVLRPSMSIERASRFASASPSPPLHKSRPLPPPPKTPPPVIDLVTPPVTPKPPPEASPLPERRAFKRRRLF